MCPDYLCKLIKELEKSCVRSAAIREARRGRSHSAPENTIVDELKRDLEETAQRYVP